MHLSTVPVMAKLKKKRAKEFVDHKIIHSPQMGGGGGQHVAKKPSPFSGPATKFRSIPINKNIFIN